MYQLFFRTINSLLYPFIESMGHSLAILFFQLLLSISATGLQIDRIADKVYEFNRRKYILYLYIR